MTQLYGRRSDETIEYIRSVLGTLHTAPRPLSLRYDAVDSTTAYLGEAIVGSSSAAAAWRVAKLTFGADGDVTKEFADGDELFDNVWDDRASLSYS